MAVLLFAAAPGVPADDGHDHGEAPATRTGPALPRFAAVSEHFELVGVLDDGHLALYLDRADDNSPVTGATLELSVGGIAIAVEEHAPGEFEGSLAAELEEGELAVVATVAVGQVRERLTGELDIHHDEHADEHDHGISQGLYGAAAGAALLLVLLGWAVRRARTASRLV
ncbi:hypothetical protein ACFS3C_09080 [Azotobacter vinelandii]